MSSHLPAQNALLLHINYFEPGLSCLQACAAARRLGVDGLEFRRKPSGYAGTDLDYLDEVSLALERFPLEWVSFGGPGVQLMTGGPGDWERELEAAEAFYRKAADRFPLRVVNVFAGDLANPDRTLPHVEYWHHGSAIANEEQWQRAVGGFRRLGALAVERNFRMGFETHGVYLHDTVPATMRLVEEIACSHVGMLWDQANLMLFPNPPSLDEVIRAGGDKLVAVHLKNLMFSTAHFLAVSSLSSGIINIREQVRLLRAAGYAGPWCLESPRPGDRLQFAREDVEYFRNVLAELEDEASL